MRLNQFLAHAGLGSRRSVEALIQAGRVGVNGEPATLQSQVDPEADEVSLDGRRIHLPEKKTFLLLNKPPGFTVTRNDPHAEKSVYELLPPKLRKLAYVGRLDRDSEGLLLFCDDGELSHRLQLPSYRIEREYRVEVEGEWTEALGEQLVKGVQFESGPPLSARSVEKIRGMAGGAELRVVLQEGKKREIRRLCAAFKLKVKRLCRIRFGAVELADLARGQVRTLSEGEILALRQQVGLAEKSVPGREQDE